MTTPPRNRIELQITVSADSWDEARRALANIEWTLEETEAGGGTVVNSASGSPGNSWSCTGDEDPSVDPKERAEALAAWCAERRASRAGDER